MQVIMIGLSRNERHIRKNVPISGNRVNRNQFGMLINFVHLLGKRIAKNQRFLNEIKGFWLFLNFLKNFVTNYKKSTLIL